MKKVVIAFDTNEKTDRALRHAAADKRISRSKLIREIVEKWLKQQTSKSDDR